MELIYLGDLDGIMSTNILKGSGSLKENLLHTYILPLWSSLMLLCHCYHVM